MNWESRHVGSIGALALSDIVTWEKSLHPLLQFSYLQTGINTYSLWPGKPVLWSQGGVREANTPCPRSTLRRKHPSSPTALYHTASTSRAVSSRVSWKIGYFCGRTDGDDGEDGSPSELLILVSHVNKPWQKPELLWVKPFTSHQVITHQSATNRSWIFPLRKELSSFISEKKNLFSESLLIFLEFLTL